MFRQSQTEDLEQRSKVRQRLCCNTYTEAIIGQTGASPDRDGTVPNLLQLAIFPCALLPSTFYSLNSFHSSLRVSFALTPTKRPPDSLQVQQLNHPGFTVGSHRPRCAAVLPPPPSSPRPPLPAMSRSQQDQFIDDDEEETCPLCVEEFDLGDRGFKPCPCGYQVSEHMLLGHHDCNY